jgi:hypothetical protein
MSTGDPLPGGKARPGRDADPSPLLVSRSWMSRSNTSSPPAPNRCVVGLRCLFTTAVFHTLLNAPLTDATGRRYIILTIVSIVKNTNTWINMHIKMVVLWHIAPCILVQTVRSRLCAYCLHLQGNKPCNVDQFLWGYTVQHFVRGPSSYSPPQKPEMTSAVYIFTSWNVRSYYYYYYYYYYYISTYTVIFP